MPCGNVLTQVTWTHHVSKLTNRIKKLGLDQMNLPEIGMFSKPFDVKKMLVRHTCMGVTLDAEILNQIDGIFRGLAKLMFMAELHADHMRTISIFVGVWCGGMYCGSLFVLHVSSQI